MARKKKTRVFVSYSRHDEALVRPLAGLLGVAADEAVFLDVTSIKPGDLWDVAILEAVRQSSVFVLCWCCKSSQSSFVKKEIDTALLDKRKRIVPVIFCSIPLPEALAHRQWIDLQGKIVHQCGSHELDREEIEEFTLFEDDTPSISLSSSPKPHFSYMQKIIWPVLGLVLAALGIYLLLPKTADLTYSNSNIVLPIFFIVCAFFVVRAIARSLRRITKESHWYSESYQADNIAKAAAFYFENLTKNQ